MNRTATLIGIIVAMLLAAPQGRLIAQESTPALTEAQIARLLQRMLGTWEMNLQKTKFFIGEPFRKKTVIYAPSKESPLAIEYTQLVTYADGSQTTRPGVEPQYFDGKERQYTAPNLLIMRRPLDEFRAEVLLVVKGYPAGVGVYAHNTQEVSPDGKQLTVTTRSFNQQGKEVVTILQVFDKVEK